MNELKISAIIVDSRGDTHPDWVETAVQSIRDQIRPPDEVVYIQNRERKMTIGECYNLAVQQAKYDYVIFLDDDDWWASDYVLLHEIYAQRHPECIAWTCYMMVFNDVDDDPNKGKIYPLIDRIHRGIWRRDYLLKYPYNEKLPKGIDREHMEEVKKRGDKIYLNTNYFGYFYRKHSDYSCAAKIKFTYVPKEILFNATQTNFIDPIAKKVGDNRCNVLTHPFTAQMATDAKVIWCEWANDNAIKIANYEGDVKKYLRLHAYEAYNPIIHYIPFEKYDKVIFIAEHIKDYVEKVLHKKLDNAVIIKNGVDLNKFPFYKHEKNNKIAWAGIINRKKGVDLLMFLAQNNPDYEFHVAGKYEEDDIAQWVNETKPENMFIHEYQYDIKEFFKDKTYILNTSPREGCPLTVLEGMACGLKPVINNWVGAQEIFEGGVFKNNKEFREILEGEYIPGIYRKFIEDNHDLDKIYENQLKELFECHS